MMIRKKMLKKRKEKSIILKKYIYWLKGDKKLNKKYL